MKIAVINEVSARDKNPMILAALAKYNHIIYNVGMNEGDCPAELTYIHTGLMAGILLNLGTVDMVIGGCGTGQGFLISAMQYPNVYCGLIAEPLDAYLFGQINGGNCISLPLNKGFGWAGDINLNYIFEKLFQSEFGKGYPKHREESQQQSRKALCIISNRTHKTMQDILLSMEKNIISTVMSQKPFTDLIKNECTNEELKKYIIENFLKG
jgi:ribose 5-phosphate isomerase RpiB